MNAPAKIGRPSAYHPEIAEALCDALSSSDQGLEEICDSDPRLPAWRTVYGWLRKHDDFAQCYARARQAQADFLADQIVPLSDTAQGLDAAGVQAVKLRTDARKWAASKFNPSVYGDKLDVTSAGKALAAPSHQIDARVQSIVMQAAERMRLAGGLSEEAKGLLE
jgi:hypothetical protein